MRRSLIVIQVGWIALAAALGAPSPARALWSSNPAVNNNVCTAVGNQDSVRSVSDDAGGIIMVWQDARGGGADIYAQRLDRTGIRAAGWTVNGTVICNSANQQLAPVICRDDSGGAIIAWQDRRNGTDYNIFAQRIRWNGSVAWAANGVLVCNAANDQTLPDIVSDGLGGAVVTWEDRRTGATNSDIRAVRLTPTGAVAPGWTANGTAICTQTGNQLNPRLCTDMLNGALIVWQDLRGASYDIYATRILNNAAIAVGFPADGQGVCLTAGDQTLPRIDSDSTNGAIIAWEDRRGADSDIYAQHIDNAGITVWGATGLAVCAQPSNQTGPIVIADGLAGGFIGWTDARNSGITGTDIYAQLVPAGGAPAWAVNGVAVCSSAGDQILYAMVRDCANPWGAFLAWEDNRHPLSTDVFVGRILATGVVPAAWVGGRPTGTAANNQTRPDIIYDGRDAAITSFTDRRAGNDDIYCQRITCPGVLGDPNPVINAVSDVPNDQGGYVRLVWLASPVEHFFDIFYPIDAVYRVWRQSPGASKGGVLGGALPVGPEAPDPRGATIGTVRQVFDPTATGGVKYWELVATVPARGFDGYSLVTKTTADSVAGSNPPTEFLVQFEDTSGYVYNSDPASGYSVDNLAPASTQQFAGYYKGGVVHLSWQPNSAADLGVYRLYRGTSANFVPGTSSLLTAQADTSYIDTSPGYYYYKLAAVDVHGNVGPYSVLAPNAVGGVLDGQGRAWLGRATPNPFRAGTSIRFGLAAQGHVSLIVFDISGRLVRRLLDTSLPAGDQNVTWDGKDQRGRVVADGLYLYRLEQSAGVFVGRVIKVQ